LEISTKTNPRAKRIVRIVRLIKDPAPSNSIRNPVEFEMELQKRKKVETNEEIIRKISAKMLSKSR